MKIDESLFTKGLTVGVALSGGRDSAVLFHYLIMAKARLGIEVVAVNVEHGIRASSKMESELLDKYCKKLEIPIRVYSVNVPEHAQANKKTIEQSARILRYECFDNAISTGFCDIIATAHHGDDDAETVLMRIFRGTGVRGLGGISGKRGNIIRPMLNSSREDIDRYCEENGIKYFEDETNSDTKYTRNFIRHEVLPIIKTRYPAVVDSLLRLADTAKVDEEHFKRITRDKLIALEYGGVGIKCEDLEDEAVAFRLITEAFAKLGVNADVEERHIGLIVGLKTLENGATLDMPYFVRATKEYDLIVLYREEEKESKIIEIEDCPFSFTFSGVNFDIEEVPEREKTGLYLDARELEGAVIRTRREGDSFKRFGGGRKSLGDYFTDIKLPVRLRDRVPVIAKDNEILAVFGVEISDIVKITDKTKKTLKITGGENVFRRSKDSLH